VRDDLRDLGRLGQGLHGFRYTFSTPLPPWSIAWRCASRGLARSFRGERYWPIAALRAIWSRAGVRHGAADTDCPFRRRSASGNALRGRQIAYWATVVKTLTVQSGLRAFDESRQARR
jgi:hypothetical protein